MLGCETLFGITRGAQLRAMIEEATGQTCPCTDGRCPLVSGVSLAGSPALAGLAVRPVA